MSSFSLKIIASDKVFYDGRAEALTIPAMDGQKQILPHHENMVIAVNIGELKFRTEDGTVHQVVVGKGFAETMNNRVIVLTDTAERPEDINKKRAQEALDRAMERMRQKQSIQEYHHSQAAMARAMTRLKLSSKYLN